MRQNYMIYKGKKYNSGDTIHILWSTHGYNNTHKHTGVFLDCDKENDEYRFVVDGITYNFNKICFYKIMQDKTDGFVTTNCEYQKQTKPTFKDELNIDGLLPAWLWYIFIMSVSVIFKSCIGIWILSSIIFFNYRSKKIKEAGW